MKFQRIVSNLKNYIFNSNNQSRTSRIRGIDNKNVLNNNFKNKGSETPKELESYKFIKYKIVNKKKKIYIDTEEFENEEYFNEKHSQLVQLLSNWVEGVHDIALIISGKNDKLSSGTKKIIRLLNESFKHQPELFNSVSLVITKYYRDEMTMEKKVIEQEEYRKKVIQIIHQYSGYQNCNPPLPVLFYCLIQKNYYQILSSKPCNKYLLDIKKVNVAFTILLHFIIIIVEIYVIQLE
ncbi:hypothetical protein LY90DRAFT_510370 [Neocallimastix californiae]|uniref:Uncharacterized protein n=1 Tax=Neocallimastix californiae TaxID=1754190 RepID=A0A1Y2C0U1_9FUNG|nr:hypothetical protein LY90DRAFT_510370 [Neocallimastix californiae]|eukprot:ORY40586.1 hypothetical protein LY90DRAFT_510370 [Neocallimastix californiae]